jgi:tetratricopeptide (TPR) repeat protein
VFRILELTPWARDPELDRLDPNRRAELIAEVNELLFLWVIAADRPGDRVRARRAAAVCDRALLFAEPRAPWLALKARYDASDSGAGHTLPLPAAERSPRACFQWGLLRATENQPDQALIWFERAVRLRPDRFWYQFALAFHHALYDDPRKAVEHYTAAVALKPDSSWALLNRAQVAWSRLGAWEPALRDLDAVRAKPEGLDPRLLELELGRVAERLGDFRTALERFDEVIASDGRGDLARHARLHRARVEAELGPVGRRDAWALYTSLLADHDDDAGARVGRALLALRTGRPKVAEDDLTRLLQSRAADPGAVAERASWLAARALSRLALRRPDDAMSDAEAAAGLAPSPGRLRILTRIAIAA